MPRSNKTQEVAIDENAERSSAVQTRLKNIYKRTVLPVEKRFQYDYFYESPFLSDVEFDGTLTIVVFERVLSFLLIGYFICVCLAFRCTVSYHFIVTIAKPQVMLIGQYSVGKTSFIRYLLGRDFPGQRIGPEPTTDRFTVLLNGPEERVIPGNALSVHPDLPFRGLERFGVSFLSRFEGSQVPSSVLKSITLIDTP